MRRAIGVLLIGLVLSGCGINDNMSQMSHDVQKETALTPAMKQVLDQTKSAMHLQILTQSLEGMRAPENTISLAPPVLIMPYAKTFADEATPDEIAAITYLLWEDAAMSPDDDALKHGRLVSLVSLSAIAGFTSRDKVSQIIQAQITQHGIYEEAAYHLGACRYVFTRDFFITPVIEDASLLNPSLLQEVSDWLNDMRDLAHAPFATDLRALIPSLGVDFETNAGEVTRLGKRAKRRFLEKLSASDKALPDVQKLIQGLVH